MITAIDLFAGLGGWTLGARRAGVKVLYAANHWPAAVQYHACNHPETIHVCQDLQQADWSQIPRHDLLLTSPACQGHAKARGKERPHHDACRSTAWAVVSCVEYHHPKAFTCENVVEFVKWKLFKTWCGALEEPGYAMSINIINAADCGLAQDRIRVVIVGVRGKHPLVLPKPELSHVPATQILDFKAGNWSPIKKPNRAAATLERYAHGRKTFGDRFVFSYYGNTRTSRSIDRPLGTITTRDRWAVVKGDRMRMLSIPEARAAMGFPDDYQLPSNSRLAMHMLGNAVPPPMAQFAVEYIQRVI